MMHRPIRSQLAKYQPVNPWDDDDIRREAAKLWHEQGVLMVHPNELFSDFDRQAVINIGNRLYGRRG